MPPKPKQGASKKTVDKAKNKIVEDKTFGLKNKNKSSKVQKYIQGVAKNVKGGAAEIKMNGPVKTKKDKELDKERDLMEKALLKPVVAKQKVPVGVDPKSIVCEFFKSGQCTKGDKCKFSHNLDQARKTEKIDLYTDRRAEDGAPAPEDDMENWDQNKLESVVQQRHSEGNKRANKTDIVCKYFLEAVENKKYGWFWECPNGGDKCMYMHALPPGYVLKSKKKEEEAVEEIPIEEQIEEERAKLATRTPITLEIFMQWKEKKKKERDEKQKADAERKEADIKSGKAMRSGRDLFTFNPSLFIDEEDVLDTGGLEPEADDGPVISIDVTGTSIRTTITNANDEDNDGVHNEGKEEISDDEGGNGHANEVNEDLFVDDIPDDDEEGDDGQDEE